MDGQGVLIMGASGSGKSCLALQLIALGAKLVADDRVVLSLDDGVKATSPDSIKGMIEARFIGILNAAVEPSAKITCAIDLDEIETERLPKRRFVNLIGQDVPLLRKVEGPSFAPAILQILRYGLASE